MNMTNKHDNSELPTTIIIKRDSGNALGIVSFVFGLISIFVLAPVFVPLAVIVGVIAVIKKQFAWGIIGLVCAFIGFFTSPILLGLVGALSVGSVFLSNEPQKRKPLPVEKSSTSSQQPSPTVGNARGKSLAEVSPPSEIANQPKDGVSIKDTIQRDFKAGPVTVSTYGKCSPIMDECESYAVLQYGDQSLKIDSIGSESHPISDEEVSWVDNRYVTIEYARGGNCWNCNGITVASLDNGKLFYLGTFLVIKDGYLINTYDVLEHAIVPHAAGPGWPLYFKNIENKAVLDVKHTCLIAKDNTEYEKDKKELLAQLAAPGKLELPSEREDWSNEETTAPLFRTLALARYCGWQNESIEILNAVKHTPNNLVTWEALHKISSELSGVEQPLAEQ